jgi:hypothetical protein
LLSASAFNVNLRRYIKEQFTKFIGLPEVRVALAAGAYYARPLFSST